MEKFNIYEVKTIILFLEHNFASTIWCILFSQRCFLMLLKKYFQRWQRVELQGNNKYETAKLQKKKTQYFSYTIIQNECCSKNRPSFISTGYAEAKRKHMELIPTNKRQTWQDCSIHTASFLKKLFRASLWRSGWESACQCRGQGFEPWSGKIPHATEQVGP